MQRLNSAYEALMQGDDHAEWTWQDGSWSAAQQIKKKESFQYYEDLPELMFIYRAGGRPPVHPLVGLRSGLIIAETNRSGPRFRRCVAMIAEVRNGAVIAYALNRATPISHADQKMWEDMKVSWAGNPILTDVMRDHIRWGGPCGYPTHRVLAHRDDELAGQTPRTVRTAGGIHYDCDVNSEKVVRSQRRGGGEGRLMWGYLGWAPGVLDNAVRKGFWRVLCAPPRWAEGRGDDDEMWTDAMHAPAYKPPPDPSKQWQIGN